MIVELLILLVGLWALITLDDNQEQGMEEESSHYR